MKRPILMLLVVATFVVGLATLNIRGEEKASSGFTSILKVGPIRLHSSGRSTGKYEIEMSADKKQLEDESNTYVITEIGGDYLVVEHTFKVKQTGFSAITEERIPFHSIQKIYTVKKPFGK